MRIIRRRFTSIVFTVFIVLLVVFYYLSDGAVHDILSKSVVASHEPPGTWDNHPIVRLHQEAVSQFEAFTQKQSRSPDDAMIAYKRRYNREPPPGFRRWVEYALVHGSPVIDDFDIIAEGVHPLLRFSGAEIIRRIDSAFKARKGGHIELCEFSGGRFGPGCRHWAAPLNTLLGGAGQLLPDIKLLINFLDEPSVLLTGSGMGNGSNINSVVWTDLSRQSIAPAVSEACRARGETPTSTTKQTADQFGGLHFVTNATAQRDMCQHPEYASQHGMIMYPSSFQKLATPVPILSRAAPQPFSDILYPATHYSLPSSLYSSWSDWRWSLKKNAVYWTGSLTGGDWTSENWRNGHRQRLVALAQGKDDRKFTFLKSETGASAYEDRVDTSLFDVGLTRILGCNLAPVCDAILGFFGPLRRNEAESRPMRYRFALDIDGQSFSGRFYRFLASRSVPLKVTIFREWHDERLVPWLHYVPISLDMGELPETVRFLTSTSKGQEISRRIADAGREWYQRAMAPTHQGIYMYRLMLELARLQDESRVV